MKLRTRLVFLVAAIASFMLLNSSAFAYPSDSPENLRQFGFLVRMGFEYGGEKLVTVRWSDGSRSDLRAGGIISLATGLLYRSSKLPLAIEATIGYKVDDINGSNGSVSFHRFPIDVIGSLAFSGHRIGVGPTLHIAPSYSCDIEGICDRSYDFNSSFGGIAQYAWNFLGNGATGAELGLRITYVQYKSDHIKGIDSFSGGFFISGML